MQRLWPGVQLPVQSPLMHTLVHISLVIHRPALLQVWAALLLHRFWFGEHSPPQVPLPQTNGQASVIIHCPPALQV